MKWYRLAAQQGSPEPERRLGTILMTAIGDYTEAAKWFRLAAEQGDAEAQVKLGSIYVAGKNTPLDYGEPAKWFRSAAEGGQPEGQKNLGMLYLNGRGVQTNVVYALMWYDLVSKPDASFSSMRQKLADGISEDQRTRARKLADACASAKFKNCANGSEIEFPVRPVNAPEILLAGEMTAGDYPPISQRLQEQGNVLVKYQIGRDGLVAGCTVTRSSGKPRLDEGACRVVSKWLFLPAMQDGMPIEKENDANIAFRMQ